jgi:hypothetical protein
MASREEKDNLWEQRLQGWKDSSLSAAKWCREQNISYATFCYWKSKLQTPVQEGVIFEELKEPSTTAIELRWGEARLYLSEDFDIATLEKCLIVLRRVQC